MAKEKQESGAVESSDGKTAAVAKPKPAKKSKTKPRRKPPQQLPPWKVLLHNDDVSEMEFVIRTIMELTRLNQQAAIMVMVEAHKTGVALVVATHREHAELLQEQFTSKKLTVTIEPDR